MKFFVFLFLVLFVSLASAHLDAGEDVEVNGYIVDLGYSPEVVGMGEMMLFSLALVEDGEALENLDVWVRVSNNDEVLFAGEIDHDDVANFNLRLHGDGPYEIKVRFSDGLDVLAETNFEIVGQKKNIPFGIVFVVIVLLIGIFIMLRRKR